MRVDGTMEIVAAETLSQMPHGRWRSSIAMGMSPGILHTGTLTRDAESIWTAQIVRCDSGVNIGMAKFRPTAMVHHVRRHALYICNLRKVLTLNASAKCRHQSRSASSPNYKSVGDEPPSPLQCAAARPPMMALLLGAIEAPREASSQLARASEVTWKWSVFSLLLVFRASLAADPVRA